MEKKMIIKEITRMLKTNADSETIHLIYLLLLKTDKKPLTAMICSEESSPID